MPATHALSFTLRPELPGMICNTASTMKKSYLQCSSLQVMLVGIPLNLARVAKAIETSRDPFKLASIYASD
jgi:hypothetical protein